MEDLLCPKTPPNKINTDTSSRAAKPGAATVKIVFAGRSQSSGRPSALRP